MDEGIFSFILLISMLLGLGISYVLKVMRDYRYNNIDYKHVNEESFQRYAKFYGNTFPSDKDFNEKLNSIYNIIKRGETDIDKIAKNSNCTIEETVLKIRYLKNKRLLGDIYIDTNNLKLLECTKEDEKLLDKYKPYVYGSHLQVNEIANLIPNKGYKSTQELRDEVFNELLYLDNKGLINGIKIDDIDRKIIYYTLEKRKVSESYESVHCPNCGAINDVEINGKVRCGYCKGIIKGTKCDEKI